MNNVSGIAALVNGTITVSNTDVQNDSDIFIKFLKKGLPTYTLSISAIVAGVSFTISSTDASDNRSVAWCINS